MTELPLITIVGQTASGKTALALELAEQYNGEIICADSRTVYRYMDIGTAKPTADERARVPHHLLDVINPDEQFNVMEFKRLANQAIADIRSRNKLPLLVGGTGLYVDAVLFDFTFRPADPTVRAKLDSLSLDELQTIILERDLPIPINEQNRRHLIRVIESNGAPSISSDIRSDALVYGISVDRDTLAERIRARVDAMVQIGFIAEVRQLAKRYGWGAPGMQAPGYRAFKKFIEHEASEAEAIEEFIHNDLQLAKRQRTWFRRNKYIQWHDDRSKIVDSVTTILNK